MEQNAASYNPGRMDQYLWPYFKADLGAGRLTRDEAQELLDCLWVKFSEPCLFKDALPAEFAAGYPMFQNVCAGGVDNTGQDAVNELSYMILQATDDVYTDEIAGSILTFIADEIEKHKSKYGRMTPGILPVSGNTPFGLVIGALPSGRRAWKPLADGVSPTGGTDFHGPGAVLKSVAHIPHGRFVQGTLLNMKIEPALLTTENGIAMLMALLKSLCSLGVYHVQFNVIDQEKLVRAQKHPEDYRGLLVRVAGYTAYFVELGKDVQDEIIGRTVQHGISVG